MIDVLRGLVDDGVYTELARLAGEDWRTPWGARLIQRPSPNYWPGRHDPGVRCVVWHITDGDLAPSLDWLTTPGSDASSNDVISREGVIYNLVAGDDTPWTNGPVQDPNMDRAIVRQAVAAGINPNRWSYTIECVGRSTAGAPGALTSFQAATLIGRTAQACVNYRLSCDREHILRHSDWDSVTRANCPGYSGGEMAAWTIAAKVLAKVWRGW